MLGGKTQGYHYSTSYTLPWQKSPIFAIKWEYWHNEQCNHRKINNITRISCFCTGHTYIMNIINLLL